MPFLDPIEQSQAGFSWHADVGYQYLRLAVLQCLEHLVRRGKGLVGDTLARESLFEHPTNGAIVIHDPDGVHGIASDKLMIVISVHVSQSHFTRRGG